MGVGATFWTTFLCNVTKESVEWATFGPTWASFEHFQGNSLGTPARGGSARPREHAWRPAGPVDPWGGVIFPLKNKVEGLSPSTPRMV